MGRRRVAENDSDFDQYINNTSKTLESGSPIGSVRLGLSNNEKLQWLAYRDEWNLLYPRYANLDQRTKTIKDEKNRLKKDFTAFAARPLGKIAVSNNITTEDRATFRVPKPKRTQTPRGNMVGEAPVLAIQSLGSAIIKVRVRLENSVGRPRKHPWADAVEMKYAFADMEWNTPLPQLTPADCPFQHISKKASFAFNAGPKHQGKRLFAFVRWVNFTNPSHNSGWSNVVIAVVG